MSLPEYTSETMPPNVVRVLPVILGWVLHMMGGKVTIPKRSEVEALLHDYRLDVDPNPDGTATVSLRKREGREGFDA